MSIQLLRLRNPDLSGMTLDVATKKAIAKKINEGHERPNDVAKQYNLPVNRITLYARKERNGLLMSDSLGRPYMIDEESTKTLVKSLEGKTATRSEELNHKLFVASQTTKKNQGQAACTARMPNWVTKIDTCKIRHVRL